MARKRKITKEEKSFGAFVSLIFWLVLGFFSAIFCLN
jgi:hypothetical protein